MIRPRLPWPPSIAVAGPPAAHAATNWWKWKEGDQILNTLNVRSPEFRWTAPSNRWERAFYRLRCEQ